MKVSAKTQYGLRALIYIAKSKGDVCSLKEIAQKEGISFAFLEKILSQLEKSGIIKSKLGVKGGYKLSKPAGEIKMIDALEALDSEIISVECLHSGNICPRHNKCHAKTLWTMLEKDVYKSLGKITLQSLTK